MTHLSHERSEEKATAFLAAFKARTDGHAPLFTSDKLPAYVAALIANYQIPSDLVVDRWASDSESGSHCSFLLRYDVWTTLHG